jgi:hypothetical protein
VLATLPEVARKKAPARSRSSQTEENVKVRAGGINLRQSVIEMSPSTQQTVAQKSLWRNDIALMPQPIYERCGHAYVPAIPSNDIR